ncbi:MAG: sensor histidine kinase [Flavobacteriales bacterium]|nr:sensor histidine kinase [Flavobacteriales bacterium]
MAEEEENQDPHFDISAYVVKQLGEELVSDEVTALMELVKNAYDADSTYVKINISTTNRLSMPSLTLPEHKGYIIIEDGGDGMNKGELTKGWLTISSSKKREIKRSGGVTRLGRTPQGDKGLGRLSAQRLGRKLEIITGKAKDDTQYHVGFNFDDFKEGTMLAKVPVRWTPSAKVTEKKGTKLIILDLKNPSTWSGEAGKKIIGRLSQLISPYKDQRPFAVSLVIDGKRVDFDTISDKLRNLAISRFTIAFDGADLIVAGRIKLTKLKGSNKSIDKENFERLLLEDGGNAFLDYLLLNSKNKWAVSSNVTASLEKGWYLNFEQRHEFRGIGGVANNLSEEIDEAKNRLIANPGAFTGEINEFNLDSEDQIKGVFSDFDLFKSLIQEQAGVKVYRDGFGIRPFGLDGNDWLNLARASTSGDFYSLRPNNVMGFIALNGSVNKHLQEKTDREGFVETPYSRNFHVLISHSVKQVNDFLTKIRRAYNSYKEEVAIERTRLPTMEDTLKMMASTGKSAEQFSVNVDNLNFDLSKGNLDDKVLSKFFKELKVTLDQAAVLNDVADLVRQRFSKVEEQAALFAELAALGMTAEAISHEFAEIANRLAQQTEKIEGHIEKQKLADVQLNTYLEYVSSAVSAMRRQLGHLAPSLRYVREKEEVFEVKEFLTNHLQFYSGRFAQEGIRIELIEPFLNFKVKVNRGKLTQIFDNVILNSEFWLKEFKKANKGFHPKICIEVTQAGSVLLYDNGLGVEPSLEEVIFEPFVSGKSKGRGLGLYIVTQLLEPHGCSISLQPNRNEFRRKYIFRLDLSGMQVL